jgi:hypothetical protein
VYGVTYFYNNYDTIRLNQAYGCDCNALVAPTPDMSPDDAALAQGCMDTCNPSSGPSPKYQTDSFK